MFECLFILNKYILYCKKLDQGIILQICFSKRSMFLKYFNHRITVINIDSMYSNTSKII